MSKKLITRILICNFCSRFAFARGTSRFVKKKSTLKIHRELSPYYKRNDYNESVYYRFKVLRLFLFFRIKFSFLLVFFF